jgi:hypothetical protein
MDASFGQVARSLSMVKVGLGLSLQLKHLSGQTPSYASP